MKVLEKRQLLDKSYLFIISYFYKNGKKYVFATCSHNRKREKREDCINKLKSCCPKDTLPVGKKIGRLTIVSRDKKTRKVICLCECGNKTIVHDSNLFKKNTTSCGCLHKESFNNKKHGHSTSKKVSITYRSWSLMKTRCLNKNTPMYQAYGKMGISVCQRWIESFEKFLEDMGERPSKYYSIDRINTNGDYEPSNCRWATAKEQANNRNKRIDSVKNINCLFCKKEFRPKRKETKYCSSQCFGDSIRKMTTI